MYIIIYFVHYFFITFIHLRVACQLERTVFVNLTVIICCTWSTYSVEILIDSIMNQIFQMTWIFFNQLIFFVSGAAICRSAPVTWGDIMTSGGARLGSQEKQSNGRGTGQTRADLNIKTLISCLRITSKAAISILIKKYTFIVSHVIPGLCL